MKLPVLIPAALILLFSSACALFSGIPGGPIGNSSPVPASMQAATPGPTASFPAGAQFIAYVRDGQLLVTDISNGAQGGTTQYTAPGQAGPVTELAWSPSGEFIAFVAPVQEVPHIYYIFALGQSSPVDLGPGSSPAWSPDSASLAYIGGSYPDENIWVSTINPPAARQLSFESNHAWGRPAFTPDDQALIVTTADRIDMGAQGNVPEFFLERLELDGSGRRAALPGSSALNGMRLPYDLHFSPDGTRLAFSGSSHFSACASPGAYYVSDSQAGNRQELTSPALAGLTDPANDRYHTGLGYAWSSASDALLVSGIVLDCKFDSPTMGQVIAGPQMSILRLDGSEGPIIPGLFYSPSMDHTGTLAAAAHYLNPQDESPTVEIYSAVTGQLLLSAGPGRSPQLQP